MVEIVEIKPMLLPPPPGHCRICAYKHEPEQAHNATTLFYQTRFQLRYGRPGTWADAVAHMPVEHQSLWRGAMEDSGVPWTEPPDGVEPISEPIDG